MLFTWLFLVQSRECREDDVELYNELRKRDLHMGVVVRPLHLHPYLLFRLIHPKCLTLGSSGKLLWLLHLGQLSAPAEGCTPALFLRLHPPEFFGN